MIQKIISKIFHTKPVPASHYHFTITFNPHVNLIKDHENCFYQTPGVSIYGKKKLSIIAGLVVSLFSCL